MIVSKPGSAVLIGEDDWLALQKTLHLNSIPGMTHTILDAKHEPLDEGSRNLDW